MRFLHRNREATWSQQQLAFRHRAEAQARRGWFSWERQRTVIHAAKTALAAAVCWWLALRFGMHDGYWGAISAIIVLQSNFGATLSASRDRIIGTLTGAAFGFTFSLFGTLPWNYIAAVFAAVAVCGLTGFRSSSRLAGVTITIVMLVQSSSRKVLAVDRVGQVILGIFIALAVTTLVFPDRARLRLRDGLAQEMLALGAFFKAILASYAGEPSDDLAALREQALAWLRTNNQLLDAARNEPAGGRGDRECLVLLSQSGRALFDALVALELAVRGGADHGYAQQLEPALGKLVADIEAGFQYVATCIHHWRFHTPPAQFHLEEDIARLEERMSAARPHGIAFSQAEILRSYAVQLHLKQIARLLRAARVDASRALGETQPAMSADPEVS